MNPNHFEDLIRHGGTNDTLSSEERALMRSSVAEYLAYTPIRSLPTVHARWTDAFRALVQGRAPVLLTAFLVLGLTSASVTSAAEGALPGDLFYPVKVGILEPARLSLAASKEGRTTWERVFAERRLTEAAQLAEQGRLDPSVEATLTANFEYYANLSLEEPVTTTLAAKQAVDTTTTIDSEVSSENFSARLSAYEQVLTRIDDSKGLSTTKTLRGAIRAQAGKIADRSVEQEADTPSAERLKVAADTAIDTSTLLVTSIAPSVTATTSARAKQALRDAEILREEGDTLLKKNDPKGASRAYKNSLKATARLKVFTHAASTLNIDPFTDTIAVPATTTATTTAESSATVPTDANEPEEDPTPPATPPQEGPSASSSFFKKLRLGL